MRDITHRKAESALDKLLILIATCVGWLLPGITSAILNSSLSPRVLRARSLEGCTQDDLEGYLRYLGRRKESKKSNDKAQPSQSLACCTSTSRTAAW